MSGEKELHPSIASFRDPSASVVRDGNRILRVLDQKASQEFLRLEESQCWKNLQASGRLVKTVRLERKSFSAQLQTAHGRNTEVVLEHEPIPYVSYPYEWPPVLLQRAALHHLDLHIDLLEAGFTIVDGTAFNIQYRATDPTFIDIPSIRPYREGTYWTGYGQFCEQFLAPLLLVSNRGIPYHAWYRGSLDGIPLHEVWKLLPISAKLGWRALMHVGFPSQAQARPSRSKLGRITIQETRRPLARVALVWLLKNLRAWIADLSVNIPSIAGWDHYTAITSYQECEAAEKRQFVANWTARANPRSIYDFGGNSGEFAEIALRSGAAYAVSFDSDPQVANRAVDRTDSRRLKLLPLVLDLMNPTPAQGWAQRERLGFAERTECDAILALAILHHLALGRNAPIRFIIEWMVSLAPRGIIEFVPKDDAMAQLILSRRQDIFEGYDIDTFRNVLGAVASIEQEYRISESGRVLFSYHR